MQNNADSCWNFWWGRHCGADAGPALMVDGVGMEKHKAIPSSGAPPFVAVEWCREHMVTF